MTLAAKIAPFYNCKEHGRHRACEDHHPEGRIILKCRECRKLDNYAWRAAYPEKFIAIRTRYREKNRVAIRARNRALWERRKSTYNARRRRKWAAARDERARALKASRQAWRSYALSRVQASVSRRILEQLAS